MGRTHHPNAKTVVVPFVVGIVPVAVSTTRVPVIVVERATAQDAGRFPASPARTAGRAIILRSLFSASLPAICQSLPPCGKCARTARR
jgi:hypothetical protein